MDALGDWPQGGLLRNETVNGFGVLNRGSVSMFSLLNWVVL
jgi:hypothetical protein